MKKILLASAIALGLVACGEKDEFDNCGSTYASVSITLKQTKTKAPGDGQADNAGTADEQKLLSLTVLSDAGNHVFNAGSENATGAFWPSGSSYRTSPWETTDGVRNMALIINNKQGINIGIPATTAEHVYEGWPTGLIFPFTMTSKGFTADVKPGITEVQAANGTSADQNVFSDIEMERVVAKGIVRKSSTFRNTVEQGGQVVATLSDIKFAAVNGAKKTYLYRDKAGSRQLSGDGRYDGFASAIHALSPVKDAVSADQSGLVRLGISGVPAEIATAKAVNNPGAAVDSRNTQVFYFMENSGDLEAANMKEQGYYRFAYAKVYAVYTPASLLDVDGTDKKFVPKTGTGKYYDPVSSQEKDAATGTEGFLVFAKLKTITPEKGDTFYKGAEDGILYATKEAAASSLSAPGQLAYTYKDGKCGYRSLWNRRIVDGSNPEKLINANVRRNNAYILDIKGFAKLGFPWDESDPNDPNLPKTDPEDPNLPDPADPDIEQEETYMRVEAVILPWNVVSREEVFLQ